MRTNFLRDRQTKRMNNQPVTLRELTIEEVRHVAGGMKIRPLHDRVVVRRTEEESSGGSESSLFSYSA